MDEDGTRNGRINACETFSERVTLTGVEDLYKAKERPTQILFAVGLLLATALGLLTSFFIIQEFLNQRSAVNIAFEDDGEILFPNVTICTTAVTNVTLAKELIVILEAAEKRLKALGADRDKFLNDVTQFMSLSLLPHAINKTYLRQIDQVCTATAQALNGGGPSLFVVMNRTIPLCSLTLSNCTFDEKPYDCCSDVDLGASDGFVCYGIPLANVHRGTGDLSRRPVQFAADVTMDWRHVPFVRGDDALDGFLIIIGQPYTPSASAPVAVAPSWHGTIRLARIRKRRDSSNCIQQSHLPKLAYMPYFDGDSRNCEVDSTLSVINETLQCVPEAANYFPTNSDGCNFMQSFVGLTGISGVLDDALADFKRQFFNVLAMYRGKLGSVTKRCKPICQRWQYEPIVGYSELRSVIGTTADTNSHISWSRITVAIPSSYYEQHTEDRSSVYLILCNVGGALGVCLGLSMITVVHIIVYGLYSCSKSR